MDLKQRVFQEFDDNEKTLVFSSEIIARNWLDSYAKARPGCAVFKDRAISWDVFLAGQKQKVGVVERRLFVNQWLASHQNHLLYFSNPKYYKDTQTSCARRLASMLPFFKGLTEDVRTFAPDALKHDIDLILPSYLEFLNEKSLYEPRFEDKKMEDKKFVLVFPELFNDSKALKLNLEKIPCSLPLTTDEIKVYQNSVSEIRGVMRTILHKLQNGVPARDIAITCSCLDLYKPYLEAEASKRNIKLAFAQGKSLSEYPEGKFFLAVSRCAREDYSLDSVKDLLLNPVFPFAAREEGILTDIVAAGIKGEILDGGRSRWLSALSSISGRDNKTLKEKSFHFFSSLTGDIRELISIVEPDKMLGFIDDFRSKYFKKNYDSEGRTVENRVMGSCLDILRTLGSLEKGEINGLFSLFCGLLEAKPYSENKESEGIKVYSYPQSCSLNSDYHFVIGLDDKNSAVVLDDFPFLSEVLDITGRSEVGETVLAMYANKSFCPNVELSGTNEGLDGARLIPTYFRDTNQKEARFSDRIPDAFDAEETNEKLKEEIKCTSLQQKWYQKATLGPLAYSDGQEFPPLKEKLDISASNIKDFRKCPYKGYAQSILSLRDEDYTTVIQNPLVLGNILHQALQDALKEVRSIANLTEEVVNRHLAEATSSLEKDVIQQTHITEKYKDKLAKINGCNYSELYRDKSLKGCEITVSGFEITKGLFVKGRIDCVLQDEEGNFYLFDFKTNTNGVWKKDDIEQTSPQLAIYAKMITEGPVKGAAYYSFTDEVVNPVWPSDSYTAKNGRTYCAGFSKKEVDEDFENLQKDLEAMFNENKFPPIPSEDNCNNCNFSRLCRRRFVVK